MFVKNVTLTGLLGLFMFSAAAQAAPTEASGVCQFYSTTKTHILTITKLPFQFDETMLVEGREFGVGTATIDGSIEMVDMNMNRITKPVHLEIYVEPTADFKRKELSAKLVMYNVFTKKTETIHHEKILSRHMPLKFTYFHIGLSMDDQGTVGNDQVVGSYAFCELL